jgi:hypothetical protein
MEVARSSFYDMTRGDAGDDTALVERMHAIQAEFPAYGYRADHGAAASRRTACEF